MNPKHRELNDLIAQLANKYVFFRSRILKDANLLDLTIAELNVMQAVGPRSERTMSEVAGLLGITPGTLTPAVDRLVAKGYASRRHSEDDRRLVLVSLTVRGREALEEHDRLQTEATSKITAPFSEDELDVVLAGARKLNAELDRFIR